MVLRQILLIAKEDIQTNVTLESSVAQGLMPSKAGASYISPFVGRLDDISADGIRLVAELRKALDQFNFQTEIIAASIRNVGHLESAALAGAHIATVPVLYSQNYGRIH